MVDKSNHKKRKEFISEGDIATLLQRYDAMTILKLLQEMAYYAEPKMDWNELVKKTSTGITSAREYQLLWRHLAYRESLLPVEDGAQLPDDESDMECELEASPAVGVDAVAEAVAHVKVMAASYVPSDSDIPEDSMVEAPLTINIPYGLQRGPQEPSDSYWSSRGMNITFPVSLQKAADGLNGNGLASSIAPRKRRKKWSAEEDEELHAAVKRRGEGSWATIAKEEFEGERTPSQLSQRWGAIKRKCDTPNASTQSGLQRTEAQIAVNRALNLAVGNRGTSKKPAVGIPPVPSSGNITGAQPNGAKSSTSLQGQQQSQSISRAATSVPTAKSRVTAKKATANSTSRAELMVTANSVAAAACMSGLGTPALVPKVEPGKNAVPVLVPKAEPISTASAASLTRPSSISSAMIAEPVKSTLPRPSGTSPAMNAEPVKAAPAASLPPSGISPALNTEPVKTALAASLPPSGISSALKAEPVKPALVGSLPRQSGSMPVSKPEPVKIASATSLPRLSGINPPPKAEPVKTAPAASLSRPSSAPKAEPVKPASAVSLPGQSSNLSAPNTAPVKSTAAAATNTQAVGPLNIRPPVNGSTNHVIPSLPSNKRSPMAPLSKGPTVQMNSMSSGFASSRLVPTPRVPGATGMPQKPSAGAAITKQVGVQKEQTQGKGASPLATTAPQPNKTVSTNSVISTGKPVPAKMETPPSNMPKKNQVLQTHTNKSLLSKPPEKEIGTVASPIVIADEAESKPKDEASKGKSPDVVTGQKGL